MAASTPIKPAFKPFVPATESRPELTARALILGAFFGVLFGAVTVYVGLRAGLTVAASIPISVLSISILRAFGRASILENNIVQTTGNAGQSIASGVIFTLPALIFLGFDLEASRIFALALFGGWLGVLFMIPLRRQLIVEEHGALIYPEGTACADVLMAGERGGSFASRVFLGLGLGGVYTLFQNDGLFALWPDTPKYDPGLGAQHLLKGSSIRADCTSEYLGVGYIIGARVAAVMFAGGVFSWLVLMPAIYFFGSHLSGPLYPGTVPVSEMSPPDLWRTYVRPMGAGAVAASGLITLIRTLPTIVSALTQTLKKGGAKLADARPIRTEHDLPPSVVFGGSAVLIVLMFLFLQFKPVPGAYVGPLANLAAALLIVVFGFLFVTVSARIVGIVGSSASPVSGMTIATLMATSAIFLVKEWHAPAFGALAITIGGVVCIAASNAGDTSQDLKTGYLIGSTPWKQQLALIFGVMVCIFSIGATLNAMNRAYEQFQLMPKPIALRLSHLPDGVQNNGALTRDNVALSSHNGDNHGTEQLAGTRRYILLNSIGSNTLDDGKYLIQPGYRHGRGAVDPGDRQRARRRAARTPDGDGDQRHSDTQAAVDAGAAGRGVGNRGRAAGRALTDFCGWRLPEHRDDPRHLRRRRDALDGGPRDGAGTSAEQRDGRPRGGERDLTRQSVRLGADCSRRNRGTAGRLRAAAGRTLRAARRPLATLPVQRGQPYAPRLGEYRHVRTAGVQPVPLRPQAAGRGKAEVSRERWVMGDYDKCTKIIVDIRLLSY